MGGLSSDAATSVFERPGGISDGSTGLLIETVGGLFNVAEWLTSELADATFAIETAD